MMREDKKKKKMKNSFNVILENGDVYKSIPLASLDEAKTLLYFAIKEEKRCVAEEDYNMVYGAPRYCEIIENEPEMSYSMIKYYYEGEPHKITWTISKDERNPIKTFEANLHPISEWDIAPFKHVAYANEDGAICGFGMISDIALFSEYRRETVKFGSIEHTFWQAYKPVTIEHKDDSKIVIDDSSRIYYLRDLFTADTFSIKS